MHWCHRIPSGNSWQLCNLSEEPHICKKQCLQVSTPQQICKGQNMIRIVRYGTVIYPIMAILVYTVGIWTRINPYQWLDDYSQFVWLDKQAFHHCIYYHTRSASVSSCKMCKSIILNQGTRVCGSCCTLTSISGSLAVHLVLQPRNFIEWCFHRTWSEKR